jgi:hypothetical protein
MPGGDPWEAFAKRKQTFLRKNNYKELKSIASTLFSVKIQG